MKYTVVWKQKAEDQLVDIWMASNDRENVSAATLEVDRVLKSDPELQGESRDGFRRVTFIPPLVVAFRIDENDRTVTILSVHERRHPEGS
jgi:plasmid stabilization system protein ParE